MIGKHQHLVSSNHWCCSCNRKKDEVNFKVRFLFSKKANKKLPYIANICSKCCYANEMGHEIIRYDKD